MTKYELKKTLELMTMVRDLLSGHIPAIYTDEILPKVIEARKQIEKDIEKVE